MTSRRLTSSSSSASVAQSHCVILIVVASSISSLLLVALLLLFLFYFYLSQPRSPTLPLPSSSSAAANPLQLRCFSYRALRSATASFNPAHSLKRGAFVAIFHSVLFDGKFVAVKRLLYSPSSSPTHAAPCCDREFHNELNVLATLHPPLRRVPPWILPQGPSSPPLGLRVHAQWKPPGSSLWFQLSSQLRPGASQSSLMLPKLSPFSTLSVIPPSSMVTSSPTTWTRWAKTNATPPTPSPTTARVGAQPHRRYYFICSHGYCFGDMRLAIVAKALPMALATPPPSSLSSSPFPSPKLLNLPSLTGNTLVQIKRALSAATAASPAASSSSFSSSLESPKSNTGFPTATASPCR
ncbi:hypothetical protein Cni_G13894 [Canna indica]|uniref:Uncharacterized protein n=1 Tax=Canna indica TaxID=4628 RepID=A0AAQ3KDG9_9LILI|nr:hypothetical protein Cni_G13894 [Canna indica]